MSPDDAPNGGTATSSRELVGVNERYTLLGRRHSYRLISFAGFGLLEPWFRSQTVARLDLHRGDSVLDVACGRGGNFPYLQRAVGDRGRIVGVDYSPTMLAGAEEFVKRKGWRNVELSRMDAAEMPFEGRFDGAICTVAMAVIPRWQLALRRMVSAVRPGGRVAILDGRLGRGVYRIWNPYIRAFAKVVGAHLDRDVPMECKRVLPGAVEEPLFGPFYFVVSGTRGAASPSHGKG